MFGILPFKVYSKENLYFLLMALVFRKLLFFICSSKCIIYPSIQKIILYGFYIILAFKID